MSHSSFVVINSKYRTTDSRSTSDFTFSLGETLNVKTVAIKSISIPNTSVNIRANKMSIIYDGNPYTIQVPVGQYNINELLTAISQNFTLQTGDVGSFAIDPFTKKVVITTPLNLQINTELELAIKIGFKMQTAPQLINTASSLPSLSGTMSYYILCPELVQGYNAITRFGERIGILCDIQNNSPYGEYIHYEANEFRLNQKYFIRTQNIQWLTIKIVDSDFNIVDLQGADVEIVLKIYDEGAVENLK